MADSVNTPQEWIRLGERDYDVSFFLSKNMNPVPVEIICFHCQQSAEKYLKAFSTLQGIEPPYTHDLDELCKLCETHHANFSSIAAACTAITNLAVQPRYDYGLTITESDFQAILNHTKNIRDFVKKELPQLFGVNQTSGIAGASSNP